jgi:hypothetical protein
MAFDPDQYLQKKAEEEFDPDAYLAQSTAGSAGPVATQAAMTAARPAATVAATQAGDAYKLAKIAGQVTPSIAGEFLRTPITSAANLTSAYVAGHPYLGQMLNTPLKAMPGAVARGIGSAIAAPESAFLMPYNMAAYEQEKIRANPNASGLQYNPYAQTVRGEAQTQNQAGAANQMRTVANQPYGNVNARERAILEQDRLMKESIRKKAYERVAGPIAPGQM